MNRVNPTPHAAAADPRPAPRRRARWKLPARYTGVLIPLVLSVLMSCIVSGVATLKSVGWVPGVFGLWMVAWGVSWVVAFPCLLVMLPLTRRLVLAVTQPPD